MIDIMTLEVMIEQMLEGDYSVFDTTKALIEADLEKEDNKRIMNLFTEVYNSLDNQEISDIQMTLSLYALNCDEDIEKFYKWVNDRLELVKNKKWKLSKFFATWDKAYTGIHLKMGDNDVLTMDKLGIANIVMMINDLKGE